MIGRGGERSGLDCPESERGTIDLVGYHVEATDGSIGYHVEANDEIGSGFLMPDGGRSAAKLDPNTYEVVGLDRDLPSVHGDTLCQMIAQRGATVGERTMAVR